jgi:mxaJ protein
MAQPPDSSRVPPRDGATKWRVRSLWFWAVVLLILIGAGAESVRARHTPLETAAATLVERPVLRVCADPNNLPFSNARREGFENHIAEMLAEELGRTVEYTWMAQRRGFIRNTLNARACDVVPGIPSSVDMVLATRPYYRSSYVFVTRLGEPRVESFDDPRLRAMRIGVHLIGDDGVNSPPVHALTQRGVVGNLVGYTVYGDYAEPDPPARLLEAVANGDVDIAVAWGPLAGWFALRSTVPLDLVPVTPQIDVPFLPHVYDIAMGVRRVDVSLRDSLEAAILRRRTGIDSVLQAYGVPRLDRVRAPRPSG